MTVKQLIELLHNLEQHREIKLIEYTGPVDVKDVKFYSNLVADRDTNFYIIR